VGRARGYPRKNLGPICARSASQAAGRARLGQMPATAAITDRNDLPKVNPERDQPLITGHSPANDRQDGRCPNGGRPADVRRATEAGAFPAVAYLGFARDARIYQLRVFPVAPNGPPRSDIARPAQSGVAQGPTGVAQGPTGVAQAQHGSRKAQHGSRKAQLGSYVHPVHTAERRWRARRECWRRRGSRGGLEPENGP
jgi:hypothetical protein